MRKRKTAFFACTALTTAALTSCNPVNMGNLEGDAGWEEEMEQQCKGDPAELPEWISFSINDSWNVDARVEISKELDSYSVPQLTVKQQLLDPQELTNRMIAWRGNPAVVDRRFEKLEEEQMENGPEIYRSIAELEDGAWMQVRNTRFSMTVGDNMPRDAFAWSYRNTLRKRWLWDDERKEELAFCPRQEAEESARQFYEELGISFLEESDVFSILCENIPEDEASASDIMPEIDRDADDGYYIVFRQGYEGIPYISEAAGRVGSSGTYADAFYGENGIEMAKTADLYELVDVGEEKQIMTLEEMVLKFAESRMNMNQKGTVTAFELCYLPAPANGGQLEYEAKPVWNVFYEQEIEGRGKEEVYEVYDAATGEQLYQSQQY